MVALTCHRDETAASNRDKIEINRGAWLVHSLFGFTSGNYSMFLHPGVMDKQRLALVPEIAAEKKEACCQEDGDPCF